MCQLRGATVSLISLTELLNALCIDMLAIVEGECRNYADTLKKWQGTDISIEEVGGSTVSGVFPL